jgi:hypothetical protein
MIAQPVELSQAHSVSAPEGRLLFVLMAFTLGHGFTSDPLYPWVYNTLQNAALPDPDRRAERLFSKAKVYLNAVAGNLA